MSDEIWSWLSAGESGSAVIRNLGVVVLAVIALPLAIWRAVVADRQAKAARQQADTAEQGLLYDRYQKGAEMLGSAILSVRLGGIYVLEHLGKEHSDQYYIQVMRLLCAYARHQTRNSIETTDGGDGERPDVQAIFDLITSMRSDGRQSLEGRAGFVLDLREADLSNPSLVSVNLADANLEDANLSSSILLHCNLSGADLNCADLEGAFIEDCDLSNAFLANANMAGATLPNTNLAGAILFGTTLSGTSFFRLYSGKHPSTGLTEEQLRGTRADLANPPRLEGKVFDAGTDEPIVWQGETFTRTSPERER